MCLCFFPPFRQVFHRSDWRNLNYWTICRGHQATERLLVRARTAAKTSSPGWCACTDLDAPWEFMMLISLIGTWQLINSLLIDAFISFSSSSSSSAVYRRTLTHSTHTLSFLHCSVYTDCIMLSDNRICQLYRQLPHHHQCHHQKACFVSFIFA